jgi:NAD+ diphosphatase
MPLPSTTIGDLALSRATVDRAAHRRVEPDLLDRLWADDATRVLVLRGGAARVAGGGSSPQRLLLEPPSAVDPADLAAGLRLYLGAEGGAEHVALALAERPGDGDAAAERWAELRQVGAHVTDTDVGLLTTAVSLANWHASHQRCPRCGAPTEPALGGWVRRCEQDGSEHYPRTDPAVIMAVVDADDRLLLGHAPQWPERRFSTIAGYVEPGESLEAAVRREVREETGVVVGADVSYRGSQPWPFPSSLMLGFRAVATSTAIEVDAEEISEARWFSRAELAAAVADGTVLLPPAVSIARRLIEDWYGGPLDAAEAWR